MPRFERRVDMAETDDDGHWLPLPMTVHWLIDGREVGEQEFKTAFAQWHTPPVVP